MPLESDRRAPDWAALYATAEAQAGLFTTSQAAEAGYSPQLLHKYLASGRVRRERRGIYRIVHYPHADQENLVSYWLWSDRVGVFSHQTALDAHDVSDILPSAIHMSVPSAWRRRRLRVPEGLILHFSDVDDAGRAWLEHVPITSVRRTLDDCLAAHVAPDLLWQALAAARQRGLLSEGEAEDFERAVDASLEEVQ